MLLLLWVGVGGVEGVAVAVLSFSLSRVGSLSFSMKRSERLRMAVMMVVYLTGGVEYAYLHTLNVHHYGVYLYILLI